MVSLERPQMISNSFSSSLAILNVWAMVLGSFLIICISIFYFTNCKENKSILNLSLHCSAVVQQICTDISPHLHMNAVRLSSLCCLKFISTKVAWLTVAILENHAYIFSLREFHESLCNEGILKF